MTIKRMARTPKPTPARPTLLPTPWAAGRTDIGRADLLLLPWNMSEATLVKLYCPGGDKWPVRSLSGLVNWWQMLGMRECFSLLRWVCSHNKHRELRLLGNGEMVEDCCGMVEKVE